jgi:hypothetical protein
MAEVGCQQRQQCLHVNLLAMPSGKAHGGEAMSEMPNSAFTAECRVPENAERCGLGLDLASLADRALGIISGVLQGV